MISVIMLYFGSVKGKEGLGWDGMGLYFLIDELCSIMSSDVCSE